MRAKEAVFATSIGDGSFVYRVPIQVPMGRAGKQPELELTYRLRAHGNGPFGTGWDIATPTVKRRTDRGFPKFDATDEFMLGSGERLVHVGGSEYRPLVDERFDSIQFVVDRWEITSPDGSRTILGADNESRVYDPAHPERVYEWRVSRVEDLNGNVTRFRYVRDDAVKRPEGYYATQLYLRRVEYTNGLDGDYLTSIVFTYADDRADAWTDFRAGFPIRTSRSCSGIWTYASDLQAGAAQVVNFDGGVFGAFGTPDRDETRVARYGVLARRPSSSELTLEFAVPLTGTVVRFQTTAGASFRVRETSAEGSQSDRNVTAAAVELDVLLAANTVAVQFTAPGNQPFGITMVTIAAARVPVVHSRYRLEYRETIADVPAADLQLDDVPPPTLHLKRIRRSGFVDFIEAELPPLEFQYRALDLTGLPPLSLSGTPADPLGSATTTLLSFAGTGRPDLFQTRPYHRVFFNQGRADPTVRLEGSQLTDSPSISIDDLDVFLRDVRGLGAVDLTTTGYFYPNPSVDGPVLRSAPAWGAARPFDEVQPHPQLSPEQQLLSRSIDLDGDGRPDLLCTDQRFLHWANAGNGAWAAVRPIERLSSFGESRFPDVTFDDPHVFIADMNGDGLDEIVRVRARKVEYWSACSGEWPYIKTTMHGSPRIRDFEPRRVVLVDITGNGAADLLYVHGNSVEVFVNVGGSRFAAGILVDFADYAVSHGLPMPNTASTAVAVDLLGEGAPGVLWSMQRQDIEPNYFYLPLSRLGKPYVLRTIDGGTGAVTELDCTTSCVLAAQDQNLGTPWAYEPPYPVIVIARAVERDLIGGVSRTVEYRYRDGWYDRRERAFRGFAAVEERRLEIPGVIEGLIVRHRFESGQANDASPTAIATARTLAGRKTRASYYRMADNALLREDHTFHTALPVYTWNADGGGSRTPNTMLAGPAPDDIVMTAFVRQVISVDVEGTIAPRYSGVAYQHTVLTSVGEVVDEAGRRRSETWFGELVPGVGAGVVASIPTAAGALTLVPVGDSTAKRTEYFYAENPALHIWSTPSSIRVWSGAAFDQLENEQRLYYDDGSAADAYLPLGQVVQGNLQRTERFFAKEAYLRGIFGDAVIDAIGNDGRTGPGFFLRATCADGEAGFFAITERVEYARAGGRIQYGVRTAVVDGRGEATTFAYDAPLWHPASITNALGHTRTMDRVDCRTGLPIQMTDESGIVTATTYDAFTRVRSVRRDTATYAFPQVTVEYSDLPFALTRVPAFTRTARLIDDAEDPRRYVVTTSYVDGFGREVGRTKTSGSHGGDVTKVGTLYGAGGKNPSRVTVPFWTADPDADGGTTEFARTVVRDPLAREIHSTEPDGAERSIAYAPWQAVFSDSEDLRVSGEHAGTPATLRYDSEGRTVQAQHLVRGAAGPGNDHVVAVNYRYDALGRIVRIDRPDGLSVDYEYAATGALLRTTHPDFGSPVRLADAAGHDIYTVSSGRTARWYLYDALGRVASEIAGANPSVAAAVAYTYDDPTVNGIGRLTRVDNVEESHTIDYEYDKLGNTILTEITMADGTLGQDEVQYNALGLPKRRMFPDGSSIAYGYAIDGNAESADYSPGVMNPEAVALFSGVAYDATGAVARAQLCGGAIVFSAVYDAATQRLQQRRYERADASTLLNVLVSQYDSVGNVRVYDEQVDATTLRWALEYDSLYRLRKASAVSGGASVADFLYHHDDVGNLIRNDEVAPGDAIVYDRADRPDAARGTAAAPNTFSYDGDGRVTKAPDLPELVWARSGRLQSVENPAGDRATFTYTHKGRLLRLSTTTPLGPGRSLTFAGGDREIVAGANRYHALLNGERVVTVTPNGQRSVPLRSIGGSMVGRFDDGSGIDAAATERFAPFGATVGALPAAADIRGFSDGIVTLGGVYSLGARGLVRAWGRFLSPDPLAAFPPSSASLFDARQINPYAFALSNPSLYVDRTGLQAKKDPQVQEPSTQPAQSGLDTKELTKNLTERVLQIVEMLTSHGMTKKDAVFAALDFMFGALGMIEAANDPTAKRIGGWLDVIGGVVGVLGLTVTTGPLGLLLAIYGVEEGASYLIEDTALGSGAFGEALYDVLDYYFPEPDPPGYRKVIADEERRIARENSTIYISPGTEWDQFMKANQPGWVSGTPNRLGDL